MKYFIVCIVFTFFLSYSYAQKFNGGILAGFTASQVDGDTHSGYHKGGIEAGAFINRIINDNFSWQLEIKFKQKGSHFVPDSIDFNERVYRLHLNYAEVPFSINYHFKKRFVLNFGIGIGYLISFKEEANYIRLYEDTDRYFNRYEVCYNFGLAYKISKKILFNISHSYSITPIRKHASGTVYKFNRGQYNNLLAFTFYYQFNNEGK